MKERILAFLRRTFRASSVLGRLLTKLVPIVLIEIQLKRLKTDAEVRAFVIKLVADEIATNYPGYEFLNAVLIEAIVDAVRDRLRRHTVN